MTFKSSLFPNIHLLLLIQFRVSNLWTVPRRDFWPRGGQRRAKPKNTRGSRKFCDLEVLKHHFQHRQINISVKKCSVNWSPFRACFHAWYLRLVRNAWEVTKCKRPCTNAIQPETLGNGVLFAVFFSSNLDFNSDPSQVFRFLVSWDSKSGFASRFGIFKENLDNPNEIGMDTLTVLHFTLKHEQQACPQPPTPILLRGSWRVLDIKNSVCPKKTD